MEGLPGDRVRRLRAAGRGSRSGQSLTGERRLVLLRHGRTAYNASGRFQGQLDMPLDDLGHEQARAVAPGLAALQPAVLFSSDLGRATGTAAPLAQVSGLAVRTDARLREIHLGGWQGLDAEQAQQRFPAEYDAWRDGQDVPRGGGETYLQTGRRAAACVLEALPEVPAGGALVAVTHGGTVRGALGVLLEVDPAHWWRFAPLSNASWSVLVEHRLGWRLERHGVPLPAGVGPVSNGL